MLNSILAAPKSTFKLLGALRRAAQRKMFGPELVFNQSWEDPAIDAQALQITPKDTVLAISGAGDNILSLALSGPEKICAIDLNPAQIYLLRLKIVAARELNYSDFIHLFCLAPAPRARFIYYNSLCQCLDPDTRRFWDGHLQTLERGLYRASHFGRALGILRTYLRFTCGKGTLEEFFECGTLAEQRALYLNRIQPRWWNPLARPFAALTPVMWLFGVRRYQLERIRGPRFLDSFETGITRVLTTLPAKENFFWQQVFLGRYLVLPPYLRPENFERLKQSAGLINHHVRGLDDILRELPKGSITCFNLLDALDWLSAEETVECWTLMQRVAAPGARVLFRSIDPSYRMPDSILAHWQDHSIPCWLAQERTGVYVGLYLYKLRENATSCP